jgi:DNA mismatch repair protein MutS2
MQEKDKKEAPQVGDLVRMKKGKTTGELTEIEGDSAVVMVGGLRLKTGYKNLVKVTDAHKIQEDSLPQISIHYERKLVKPSIDIHGMRGREAMKKVTRYLDGAIASGRSEVDIIHGKGNGILKRLVHEHLDKRPEVKSYKMASLARGGAGCTIVKF